MMLGQQQEDAKKTIESCLINKKFDKIIVVTGGPGTGKSTLINSLSHLEPVKLAFTNEAARNIGGQTIHNHFGIKFLEKFGSKTSCRDIIKDCRINGKKWIKDRALEETLYIIDEVSQVSLYMIMSVWFNIQLSNSMLVAVGDKDQIGPISKDGLSIFDLPKSLFKYIRLTKNFRCSPKMEHIISRIKEENDINELLSYVERKFESFNRLSTSQILKAEYVLAFQNRYVMEYAKMKYGHDSIKIGADFYNSQDELVNLDQVCTSHLSNMNVDYHPTLYLNDTICYTLRSGIDSGKKLQLYKVDSHNRLLMKDERGYLIPVDRVKFNLNLKYKNHLFKDVKYCKQFPLKYYNILTIFRCQGKTLDGNCFINLQGCKNKKVLYVAISRFKNPKQIMGICL